MNAEFFSLPEQPCNVVLNTKKTTPQYQHAQV